MRRCGVQSGQEWSGRFGLDWQGVSWQGLVQCGAAGMARYVGEPRVKARTGRAGKARTGVFLLGPERLCKVGQARPGMVRCVEVVRGEDRSGMAGAESYGEFSPVMSGRVLERQVRTGEVWTGDAWTGKSWQVWHGANIKEDNEWYF